jgi:hypothetical protein
LDAQVEHSVAKSAAHIPLKREVVYALGVGFLVVLLSADPLLHQLIAHCVRQSHHKVVLSRLIAILADGEVKVAVEAILDLLDIFLQQCKRRENKSSMIMQ